METLTGLRNLSEAVRYHAEGSPNKIYLIEGDQTYTYSKVDVLLDSVCEFYQSIGLRPRDIVSAVLRNSVEYILLYLASLRYGSIFNPYPYSLETNDILRYFENVKPAVVLCQDRHYRGFSSIDRYRFHLIDDYFISSLSRSPRYPDFRPSESDVACIYYSSGTTGNPKGIVTSYRNQIAQMFSVIRGFRFNSEEVHLIVLPMGHTASVNYSFLPCTICGGRLVIFESFWKARARFWQHLSSHGVTYVQVVTSILVALINTPYESNGSASLGSLRFFGCGSSALPREVQVQFMEKFNVKVGNLYGLSETGPITVDDPLVEGWQPGSIGIPLDVNEVEVVDDNDVFLGPGEVGEFLVKGENVFIGYHRNQILYEEMFHNKYLRTGDLGYVDKDGRYYYIGRKKDLIIKGGINISPEEIDEIIVELNGVEESLTIGVPDEFLGEKIVTWVVTTENGLISENSILEDLKGRLSSEKIPDEIRFIDSLPKGPSGKPLRRVLRDFHHQN